MDATISLPLTTWIIILAEIRALRASGAARAGFRILEMENQVEAAVFGEAARRASAGFTPLDEVFARTKARDRRVPRYVEEK